MKKALIISYYWPPAGGSGVQRWLKLSKYLTSFGYEPIILTVDPSHAAYPYLDLSLEKDVPKNLKVFKTKTFNPISIGAKLIGSKSTPKAGFSGGKRKGFLSQLSLFVRSNFFIPDPRKGWNNYAYSKAKKILKIENPQVVITTGPPHSTHLIGYKINKIFGLPWIADFRDPWIDIYYYQLLNHSFLSRWIDKRLERKVLKHASGLIAVSDGLANMLQAKLNGISKIIKVIPNGFDPDDFKMLPEKEDQLPTFTIKYLGTLSFQYNPACFFQAINELLLEQFAIKLRFIGTVSDEVKEMLSKYSLNHVTELFSTVEHSKVSEWLTKSDALFLVIPEHVSEKVILTGKLFEYLAATRPIIAIGPPDGEAAKVLMECKAGKMFGRDNIDGLKTFIKDLILAPYLLHDLSMINNYSRKDQAQKVAVFFDLLTNNV